MRRYFLLTILILALVTRFYDLGLNPPSLNWDEVSIGYNAYSIIKTGKDEFGNLLPFQFRSLDDYKQPVYFYLTVISEYFFGLTPLAVRLPSAILGTATVILMYFLTKELLRNQKIALLSAFFLSILPWHLQFSRMASEANIGLFFLTGGVLFFLKSSKKLSFLLPLSAIFLSVSLFSYLSFRVVIPLMVLLLFGLYWKKLLNGKKTVFFTLIIILFSLVILFVDSFFQKGQIRFKGATIINNHEEYKNTEKRMFYDAKLKINLIRRFFHDNPLTTTANIVARSYLTHFSPDFFFFDLGQKQNHAPGIGILYLWMLPLIPIGLFFLFKNFNKQAAIFILGWLLISPLPASVTWEVPHAARSICMMIPLQIIIAVGTYEIFKPLLRKISFIFFAFSLIVFSLVLILSFIYYFHQYHVHFPHEKSHRWVYGRKELVEYLEAHKKEYKKIVISTRLEWPHIFLLFYSKYDPQKYLSQGGTISGGWGEQKNKYDNYEFRTFDYDDEKNTPGILFVGEPGEFPKRITPFKIISYLNGEPAIAMVKGDK